MGGGGKGGKTQTTTQSNAPWAGVQPYLQNYFGSASQWFNPNQQITPVLGGGFGGMRPPGSFGSGFAGKAYDKILGKMQGQMGGMAQPDSSWMEQPMVAGIPKETEAAWNLATTRALAGSPLAQAAQNQALGTIQGQGADTAFNKLYGHAAGRLGQSFQDITAPAIASQFAAAGRGGSGAHQEALQRATGELGQTLGGLAADVYGQERGRQMQAIGMAPSLAAQDYADIGQLGAVGEGQRAYQQQLIDAPYQRLQQYGSLLQPGLGFGSSTTQQPLYRNPIAGGLGGALAGAQIGSIVPGIGTGLGAGLGGGLGLLGAK